MLCVFTPWQERWLDKVQEYQLIIPHCYYKQKRTFSFLPFILLHIAFCLFFKKLLATQIKKGSLINPKSALLCMWITSGAFITWLCSSGRNDSYLTNDRVAEGHKFFPVRVYSILSYLLLGKVMAAVNIWTRFLCLNHLSSGLNFLCCWKRKSFIVLRMGVGLPMCVFCGMRKLWSKEEMQRCNGQRILERMENCSC